MLDLILGIDIFFLQITTPKLVIYLQIVKLKAVVEFLSNLCGYSF